MDNDTNPRGNTAREGDYNQRMFKFLQEKIEEAEREGRPTTDFVRQQIRVLENVRQEFINKALNAGYSLNHPRVGDIEVREYATMRQLAQKIGDPTDKYDEAIKTVRIRVFGEENYKRFFE